MRGLLFGVAGVDADTFTSAIVTLFLRDGFFSLLPIQEV
jgi:hypothetical protein